MLTPMTCVPVNFLPSTSWGTPIMTSPVTTADTPPRMFPAILQAKTDRPAP
jgi:hypothetical protein